MKGNDYLCGVIRSAGQHGKNCIEAMANVFLIKVSKVTGIRTQQLCGVSTREGLRAAADRIEKALHRRYPFFGVKREYCRYSEADGIHMGYHFTLI